MIEILIVLTGITILPGISVFYLSRHERLFRRDEQALKIIDVFQKARQRSLTQRETMRADFDLPDKMALLIDESLSGAPFYKTYN